MEAPKINWDAGGFTINTIHLAALPTSWRGMRIEDGYLKVRNSKLRLFVDSTYEMGYFLGATAAASVLMVSQSRYAIYYRNFPLETLEKLQSCVQEVFGASGGIRKRFKDKEELEYVIYNKYLTNFVDINIGRAEHRRIPNELLVGHPEYLLGVLDGIVDFHGNKRKRSTQRARSSNVSRVHWLLTSEQRHGRIPLTRQLEDTKERSDPLPV